MENHQKTPGFPSAYQIETAPGVSLWSPGPWLLECGGCGEWPRIQTEQASLTRFTSPIAPVQVPKGLERFAGRMKGAVLDLSTAPPRILCVSYKNVGHEVGRKTVAGNGEK